MLSTSRHANGGTWRITWLHIRYTRVGSNSIVSCKIASYQAYTSQVSRIASWVQNNIWAARIAIWSATSALIMYRSCAHFMRFLCSSGHAFTPLIPHFIPVFGMGVESTSMDPRIIPEISGISGWFQRSALNPASTLFPFPKWRTAASGHLAKHEEAHCKWQGAIFKRPLGSNPERAWAYAGSISAAIWWE